jgi:acetyltransferase
MRDGRTVLLRPIKPEDEPLWLEMFRNFSEESIRFRFFQIIKDTPHEVRVRYCNIDYDREIAIVAELTENGQRKILGVVRVSLEPDRKSGEIAFIVADPWQGLGLGTKMVDYTIEICKEVGVETLYAIMLPDNHRAINLTKKMGFTLKYQEDGTVKGILNLKEETVQHQETEKRQEKAQNLATLSEQKEQREEAEAVSG